MKNPPFFKQIFSAIICLTLARKSCAQPQNLSKLTRKCALEKVYIDAPPFYPRCYPKAKLEETCTYDIQCTSLVDNTFCGWNTEDMSHPVCMCSDGFLSTLDGVCIEQKTCSISALNIGLEKADCPLENSFCRNHVCLCKPGFGLSGASGKCINITKETSIYRLLSSSKLRDSIENEDLKKTTTELANLRKSVECTQWALGFFIISIVLLLCLAMFIKTQELKRKFTEQLNTRKGVTSQVNVEFVEIPQEDGPPPSYNSLVNV